MHAAGLRALQISCQPINVATDVQHNSPAAPSRDRISSRTGHAVNGPACLARTVSPQGDEVSEGVGVTLLHRGPRTASSAFGLKQVVGDVGDSTLNTRTHLRVKNAGQTHRPVGVVVKCHGAAFTLEIETFCPFIGVIRDDPAGDPASEEVDRRVGNHRPVSSMNSGYDPRRPVDCDTSPLAPRGFAVGRLSRALVCLNVPEV